MRIFDYAVVANWDDRLKSLGTDTVRWGDFRTRLRKPPQPATALVELIPTTVRHLAEPEHVADRERSEEGEP